MIADRLKKLRKARGLSPQELSELLEIPKGTYSVWESGQRLPGRDALIKLADFYSVSVDYILGREVTAAASRSDNPMDDLSDEARKSVEEFIEFVRRKHPKH